MNTFVKHSISVFMEGIYIVGLAVLSFGIIGFLSLTGVGIRNAVGADAIDLLRNFLVLASASAAACCFLAELAEDRLKK